MKPPGGSESARRLLLPTKLLERIEEHARERFPEECCGILIGAAAAPPSSARGPEAAGATRVSGLAETDNVWRGDRRDRYEIDPPALLAAHVAARRDGLEVVGYYHSHPAGPAVPSDFDRRRAWPGPVYLVVAVGLGGEVAVRAWRLRPDGGGFVEERIQELD